MGGVVGLLVFLGLGLLVAWLLLVWNVRGWALPSWVLLAAPLVLSLMAVWAADEVVKEAGQEDPSFVVIDEWAGVWIALTPLLFTVTIQPQPWSLWAVRLVAPFLLCRLFDVW